MWTENVLQIRIGSWAMLTAWTGINIVGGKSGVQLTFVQDGRPSGEAYIQLDSEEDVQKACALDKHHMGKRYIEGEAPHGQVLHWRWGTILYI